MRIFRKVSVVCAVAAWLTTVSQDSRAAKWYLDNSVTAGSQNGTSWANAWQSFAAVVWGGAGVNPGDTLFLSGGVSNQVYHEGLTMAVSGTPGAPITISVGQETGHNGQVIIDGDNVRNRGIALGNNTMLTGRVGGLTNLVLRNFLVSTNGNRDTLGGTALWGAAGCTIEYAEVYNSNNGLYFNGTTNVEIRYLFLHDIWGDYSIRASGYSGRDFMNYHVHHVKIVSHADYSTNNLGGPDGVQCQNGLTLHDCDFSTVPGPVNPGQHPDGIQAMGNYHRIYNNYFANWLNSGVKCGPIQNINAWEEEYIYNNVVTISTPLLSKYERGMEPGPDSCVVTNVNNIFICNNTFVDMNFPGINGGFTSTVTNVSNLHIENNIFYNCGRSASRKPIIWSGWSWGGQGIDNNLMSAGSDGGTGILVGGGSSYAAYTQPNGLYGTPVFYSYGVRSAANDFHLGSTDIAATRRGVLLLDFFTIDKDGVLRSTNPLSLWDLGAYVNTGSYITKPIPPAGFHVLGQ